MVCSRDNCIYRAELLILIVFIICVSAQFLSANINDLYDKVVKNRDYLQKIKIHYTETISKNEKIISTEEYIFLQLNEKFSLFNKQADSQVEFSKVVFDGKNTIDLIMHDKQLAEEAGDLGSVSISKGKIKQKVLPLEGFLSGKKYVLNEKIIVQDMIDSLYDKNHGNFVYEHGGYTVKNEAKYLKTNIYPGEPDNDYLVFYLASQSMVAKLWVSPKENWLMVKKEVYDYHTKKLKYEFKVKETELVEGVLFPMKIIENYFYNDKNIKTVESNVKKISIDPEFNTKDFEIEIPSGVLIVDKIF